MRILGDPTRTTAVRAVCLASVFASLTACGRSEPHAGGDAKYVVTNYANHIRKEDGFERNGKRDGIWTTYFDDGNRCVQTVFVRGVRDGLTVGWHDNGEVRFEGQYRDEKACGTWIEWFESGAKHTERVFEDDQANGPCTCWYESGRVSSAGWFANGVQDGEWQEWFVGGQTRARGSYVKGKKQGQWEFFTEASEVDTSLTGLYVDDVLVEPRAR